MYTLVRALVLPRGLAPQWVSADLTTLLVNEIFSTYRRIIITVTSPQNQGEVYIDLDQLRAERSSYRNTLPVLLQSLGDRELTLLPSLPSAKIGYIKYNDITRCAYHAKLAIAGRSVPENYPKEDLPDIELLRPDYDTDLSLIHQYCLPSINGFFHNTDTNGKQTWVVNGGVSSRLNGQANLGLTSFLDIGKLTKVRIEEAHIHPKNGSVALKSGIAITIPQDTRNKAFFLVLGGYLVFPEDNVFFRTGDQDFMLNMEFLPYIERLLESRQYLDLSPLQLSPSELNPSLINVAEAWSDAVLKRYLLLSQSFFVFVDQPELFINKVMLRPFSTPGVFTSYQDPLYPLVVNYGRCAEYWKVKEDGWWAVTVADSFARNYIFADMNKSTLVSVSDQLEPEHPFFHSQGLLLEIGAYLDNAS